MYRTSILSACVALCANFASAADEGLVLTEQHLQAGTLSAGQAALESHLKKNPRDDQARMGLGMVQFVRSIEGLTQAAYRHGFLQPLLRLVPESQREEIPIPINPNPERLSYKQAREIIQAFASQLATAEATLAKVDSETVKLPLRFGLIRLDFDGDGKAVESETFWRIYARVNSQTGLTDEQVKAFVITFDAADACWLRGYCHLLMALAESSLAYDWRELFERIGHRVFAEIDPPSPFQDEPVEENELSWGISMYADYIALIHLINFDVSEPKRLVSALSHLEAMIVLSRRNWELIMQETDDDNEWVPSPKQTGVIPGVKVTAEMVAGWREFLTEADAILKGQKLLPFWRGAGGRGLNFRKVFTQPQRFDLVLWIQGTGVIPFLEAGDLTDTAAWERMATAFEGALNFVGFAFWFN
jgi:hypothetical protein